MQDIENNMDELFRKAAENYAPKKGESQWNNILPVLSEQSIENSTTKKSNSKKGTVFLLLVFLMIFSAIMVMEFYGNKTEITALNKSSEKNRPLNSNVNADNNNKKSVPVFQNKIKEKNPAYNKAQKIIAGNENKIVRNPQLDNTVSIPENASEESINKSKDNKENSEDIQTGIVNNTSVQTDNIDSVQNINNKKITSIKKQRKLYIGFVAAPEFNQIKSQGIKKPGFDFGIIAGYKLNSKASLETGLFLNKKKYFSDGKYFSMDKIGNTMPAGMEVMSLEGRSNFLEIPVKFKYDVLHKKNATVFSAAGISSYIMINEKNNYLTLLNGSEQQMKGSYKNVTKYFAASIDISAGYENKIGKFTDVRVEPYLQIPLKGVGIGSMPVMSAGLHIGIIKFIR